MAQHFDITIQPYDASYVRIECDQSILYTMSDHFSYEIKGAKFSPAYRSGKWDGYTRLLNPTTRLIYTGLIPFIYKFAVDNDYTIQDNSGQPENEQITLEVIRDFCQRLKLHSNGNPIEIRDYQVEAVHHAIKNNRTCLISPTSSGKSLIAYCIARWYVMMKKRILFIVPNKGLVAQMFKDFGDYSSENGWNHSRHVHQVYAGVEKYNEKLITLTTWQSIYNIGKGTKKGGQPQDGIPKSFFADFDVVIGDEIHLFKAKSLVGILERCTNAHKRIGMTGTLDNEEINHLVLQGLFGLIKHVITTAELMDAGDVTKLSIKCLKLDYDDNTKKSCKGLTYQEEMDYLVTHDGRNRFICNLAMAQKKNTIIFFQYVDKHGKVLYDMLKEIAAGEKHVVYLSGETDLDSREDIRAMIKERDDMIIIGSYGVISTGTNAPNLHVGIFASPNKSKVRTLQSIGRLLRLNTGKSDCTLFDIVDDLTWKSHKNYTFEWFLERVKMYAEAKFKWKLLDIPSGRF